MKNSFWGSIAACGLAILTGCNFAEGETDTSALESTESDNWQDPNDTNALGGRDRQFVFRDSENVRRIVFAPKIDSTTIDGYIDVTLGENDIYLIEVQDNGKLSLKSSGNVVFSVENSDGEILARDRSEAEIEVASGRDYQVRIEGEGDYQLEIETSATSANSPTRIEFLPGTDEAIAEGQVRYDFGEQDTYLINAVEDRTMELELVGSSETGESSATFAVKSPTGQVLTENEIAADLVLPERGDYEIVVEGDARYQLKVALSDESPIAQ